MPGGKPNFLSAIICTKHFNLYTKTMNKVATKDTDAGDIFIAYMFYIYIVSPLCGSSYVSSDYGYIFHISID